MYIFVKTIAIGWIYGVNKFANNVEQMTGMLPNKYWVVCWSVVAPIVMGVIFLFYCFKASYINLMFCMTLTLFNGGPPKPPGFF